MGGKRGTSRARRAEPVGSSPPPATEPRRAAPGPVVRHTVRMVNPLDEIPPTHNHTLVPGRGWVPDREV